jgi:hypothetical protein
VWVGDEEGEGREVVCARWSYVLGEISCGLGDRLREEWQAFGRPWQQTVSRCAAEVSTGAQVSTMMQGDGPQCEVWIDPLPVQHDVHDC